jgi:hypothetical protein
MLQGRTHVGMIACKIRGLRQLSQHKTSLNLNTNISCLYVGTRLVHKEGSEYMVPEETVIELMTRYFEIVSPIAKEIGLTMKLSRVELIKLETTLSQSGSTGPFHNYSHL